MSEDQRSVTETVAAAVRAVPYAAFLGNPLLPAIHGGVLGAFMELTAIAQLSVLHPHSRQPRSIDVSVEYLRTGRPVTTYARATVKKIGRRVANVHVEAWQDQRDAPIAFLRAHFILGAEAEQT